jgi:importin subunit alpha-1
MTFLT